MLRRYPDRTYERVVKLSKTAFENLVDLSTTILQQYELARREAEEGVIVIPAWRCGLDSASGVLITEYNGDIKIHIGAETYIDDIERASAASATTRGFSRTTNTLNLTTNAGRNTRFYLGACFTVIFLQELREWIGPKITNYFATRPVV